MVGVQQVQQPAGEGALGPVERHQIHRRNGSVFGLAAGRRGFTHGALAGHKSPRRRTAAGRPSAGRQASPPVGQFFAGTSLFVVTCRQMMPVPIPSAAPIHILPMMKSARLSGMYRGTSGVATSAPATTPRCRRRSSAATVATFLPRLEVLADRRRDRARAESPPISRRREQQLGLSRALHVRAAASRSAPVNSLCSPGASVSSIGAARRGRSPRRRSRSARA